MNGTRGENTPDRGVNVLAVGVGGQGIIRLSDLLAQAAFEAGYEVKKSEIHGLSQRGGSVTSHVRWGRRVFTPVIMQGEADYVLALEELEALRWAHMVKPEGRLLVNDYRLLPVTVITGKAACPGDLRARLAEYAAVEAVPARRVAERLGEPRAANTVLLGALSRHLDLPEAAWDAALERVFKPAALAVNREAFAAGREARGGSGNE